MVASNPLDEHKKLDVTLGTYGNDVPSCMTISHGKTDAAATISFERTLRVPDNQVVNNLPPSLGQFPLFSVADYKTMPEEMAKKGGIFLPMYQREAMWIKFSAREPFALKIYVGGVNAISGVPINESPEAALKRLQLSDKVTQDYVVLPDQPWLDGIASDDGRIRQFVAMPKGSGYSVEAQVTGEEKIDGMQFELTPVKRGCPESLKVKIFGSSQHGSPLSEEKILNLREKRFSDMSTMLDLKKAIEAEFSVAIVYQDLRIIMPNHSFSAPNFNDDQSKFAELWIPESSVLEVRNKKIVETNIPAVTRSRLSLSSFSGGVGAAASHWKDAIIMPSFGASAAPPPAPVAHMNMMLQSKSPERRIRWGIIDLMDEAESEDMAFAPLASPTKSAKMKESSLETIQRKRSATPVTAPGKAAERAPPVQIQAMSLAAGGLIKQSINADSYAASIWDTESTIMFNVQLLNSESFMAVTGRAPPTSPVDAKTYQQHGYPFFDIWNEELSGVKGDFGVVKSVGAMDESKAKAAKADFWGKLTSEGGDGKKDEGFKRDEPLKFPVVMLDMSHTGTFKPIKQMEEEAKKLKESA